MEVEGMIVAYVLLTHDGRCKVTDFGLSRCEELKTFTTTATMRDSVAGTPAFMAPELFEDNTFTEKSDVYSYAVVLPCSVGGGVAPATLRLPWRLRFCTNSNDFLANPHF